MGRVCHHPPLESFIAFRGKGGSRVWRCSHCGKEDVWRDSWSYWGPVECLSCQGSGVAAVVCSDECREKLKPTNPKLALEIAKWREA